MSKLNKAALWLGEQWPGALWCFVAGLLVGLILA